MKEFRRVGGSCSIRLNGAKSGPGRTGDSLWLLEIFRQQEIALIEVPVGTPPTFLGCPPEWVVEVFGASDAEALLQRDHFLGNFLVDARQYWKCGEKSPLSSGIWSPGSGARDEEHFEASALLVENRNVLMIRRLSDEYRQRFEILQRARENELVHQRLLKELELTEILQHCIVHDLNSPLTTIRATFEALEEEEMTPARRRKFLAIGARQTRKALDLIGQILNIFRSQTSPELKETNVMDAVEAVVEVLEAATRAAGITVSCGLEGGGVPEGARIMAAMPPGDFDRVLHNLLSNALRHAPRQSSILVRIKLLEAIVRLEVHDAGPGVPPEMSTRVFERFFQRSKAQGVAGLGLYYCQIVVSRCGGSIGVEPSFLGGACFWLELPARFTVPSRGLPPMHC